MVKVCVKCVRVHKSSTSNPVKMYETGASAELEGVVRMCGALFDQQAIIS